MRVVLNVSIVLMFVASGIAAEISPYPVKPIQHYPGVVTKDGVSFVAIRIEDRNDQRKYFGLNMSARGQLPILVILENGSADSYILKREKLTFVSPARTVGASDVARPSASDKTMDAIGSVPSIYTILATIASSRNIKHRQNLLRVGLRSVTLSPGEAVHGFVFLPIRKLDLRKPVRIMVPLQRAGSSAVVTVDFQL